MAFFNVSAETAAKETGGNYISKSGIYNVTIKAIIVDVNDKGARTLNFFVDNNGTEQVIYGGLRLDNNDGSPSFQANIFNNLCIVAGVESVANPEEATLPIGKEGTDKDVAILPDFIDVPVKMRIQMEYNVYNGNIKEKKLIKAFYSETGAAASEIVNETESGVKLAKDMAYADNVTYKDDLTEEAVSKWIADGRPQGTAGTSSKVTAPKPTFGKKFGAN